MMPSSVAPGVAHQGYASASTVSPVASNSQQSSRSSSPLRPPVSPITPVATFAQLASSSATSRRPHLEFVATADEITALPYVTQLSPHSNPTASQSAPPASFMEHPAPVPIGESTNPDAIALRAAISTLQIQRDKAKRDIETLEALKTAAVVEPKKFTQRLLVGKLKQSERGINDPLRATFDDAETITEPNQEALPSFQTIPDNRGGSFATDVTIDADKAQPDYGLTSTLSYTQQGEHVPQLPEPQNIIRMPPINWGKYHIIGEPLERMHEEQRRRPGSLAYWQAPQSLVSAPYSPWKDKVEADTRTEHPMQTRRGSQKPP